MQWAPVEPVVYVYLDRAKVEEGYRVPLWRTRLTFALFALGRWTEALLAAVYSDFPPWARRSGNRTKAWWTPVTPDDFPGHFSVLRTEKIIDFGTFRPRSTLAHGTIRR